MYDINESPVGWYVASYIIRFVGLDEKGSNDLAEKFDASENTILLQAPSFERAYERVLELAALETQPYKNLGAIDVKWEFVGVSELIPIYEDLEDGAEIMYREHNEKLSVLMGMVKSNDELRANPKI